MFIEGGVRPVTAFDAGSMPVSATTLYTGGRDDGTDAGNTS